MPSRLPKAHRAVTFHPNRQASPRVSTAIEQNENIPVDKSTRDCWETSRALRAIFHVAASARWPASPGRAARPLPARKSPAERRVFCLGREPGQEGFRALAAALTTADNREKAAMAEREHNLLGHRTASYRRPWPCSERSPGRRFRPRGTPDQCFRRTDHGSCRQAMDADQPERDWHASIIAGLKGIPAIKHSFAVVLAPASAVRWSATAYSVGVGGTFDPAAFEGAGVNEAHRLAGS